MEEIRQNSYIRISISISNCVLKLRFTFNCTFYNKMHINREQVRSHQKHAKKFSACVNRAIWNSACVFIRFDIRMMTLYFGDGFIGDNELLIHDSCIVDCHFSGTKTGLNRDRAVRGSLVDSTFTVVLMSLSNTRISNTCINNICFIFSKYIKCYYIFLDGYDLDAWCRR